MDAAGNSQTVYHPKKMMGPEFAGQISLESDLSVLYAGEQKCPPLHKRAGIRYHFLMHYVIDGDGVYSCQGREYSVRRGQAFVIFPRVSFSYGASAATPWSYYWAGFSGRKALALLREAGLTPESPVFSAPVRQRIRHCFSGMIENLSKPGRGRALRADGWLYQLLAELQALSDPPALPEDRQGHYAQAAIMFIRGNFSRSITVTDIARHIGYHPTYFSRIFKEKTGLSPQRYLLEYRMLRAQELLRETSLPVNQIASSVGYSDYFTFAKCFRKTVACTPSNYRYNASKE